MKGGSFKADGGEGGAVRGDVGMQGGERGLGERREAE